MKKLTWLFLLLPLFCSAQNYYLQTGGGFMATSYPSNNGYMLELSGGFKWGQFLRIGIGATYLKYDNWSNKPYIPLYADFKLVGKGDLKPYIFCQPGYGFYKSTPILYLSDDPTEQPRSLYIRGGFTFYTGAGLIYRKAYIQAGYRYMSTLLKIPNVEIQNYTDYSYGFSAGISIP